MVKEYIINSKKYGCQTVLLDDEDYERIIRHNFKLNLKYDKTINDFYVQFHYPDNTKKEKRGTIGLHRFVMNPLPGFQVDHINRNPLDNRKCNLRICTQQDNAKNKSRYKNNNSGFKGVYFLKNYNYWVAEIRYNNKKYRKKCYSLEEAIKKREELYNSLVAKGVINNVIYR